MDRRTLLEGVAAGALVYSLPGAARAQDTVTLARGRRELPEALARLADGN